jgi:hypothetical protein|tara:strand:+ start:396 stop:707 length:312 start_codon:yes stop_codon:yes gene_type:complete
VNKEYRVAYNEITLRYDCDDMHESSYQYKYFDTLSSASRFAKKMVGKKIPKSIFELEKNKKENYEKSVYIIDDNEMCYIEQYDKVHTYDRIYYVDLEGLTITE